MNINEKFVDSGPDYIGSSDSSIGLAISSPSGLGAVTSILSVLLAMWVSSLCITCQSHHKRVCARTELIGFNVSSDSLTGHWWSW